MKEDFPHDTPGGSIGSLPPNMSPEVPHESRYFSVIMENGESIIKAETNHIVTVDSVTAEKFARIALETEKTRGFAEMFRFEISREGDTTRITFLDRGRQLETFYRFLFTGAGIALLGYIATMLILCFFAERIVRPIAESYEKQRRFITDAGHEIKTPLTIIGANADILEMDIGENDTLAEIKMQVKRLTALTGDLVYLSKMEETEKGIPMTEFPISEIANEEAMPFEAIAKVQRKSVKCEIMPMLSAKGNAKEIGRLISILMDNALKYSPPESEITFKLEKCSRGVSLSVENEIDGNIKIENPELLFERFYRADPSRNSQNGGHGIGLSIAKAIVSSHGGKISADLTEDGLFKITVIL